MVKWKEFNDAMNDSNKTENSRKIRLNLKRKKNQRGYKDTRIHLSTLYAFNVITNTLNYSTMTSFFFTALWMLPGNRFWLKTTNWQFHCNILLENWFFPCFEEMNDKTFFESCEKRVDLHGSIVYVPTMHEIDINFSRLVIRNADKFIIHINSKHSIVRTKWIK